ncbi:MAG: rhomboid family intramembrane serine protease [Chitinophagaceae bacterium]|jgi:membrane associated rhomboid family serine protease
MSYDRLRIERRISLGDSNNALLKLVAVNLILFVTLALCRAYFFFIYQDLAAIENAFYQQILPWFVLPIKLDTLISRPWTFLSFPFVNAGVWMVLGNMLWLWAFGFIVQDLTGYRKIIPLYLYGGWASGVTFFITAQLLETPTDTGFYGAAPAVMTMAIAATTLAPQYRILPELRGGFPLWILTVFYVLINLGTQPLHQPLSYLPLVAGGLTGFLFIRLLQKGYDTSKWMSNFFEWVNNLFNPDKKRYS